MKWKLTARSNVRVQGTLLMKGESMVYEGSKLPDDVEKWIGAGLLVCEQELETVVFKGTKELFESAVKGKKMPMEVEKTTTWARKKESV